MDYIGVVPRNHIVLKSRLIVGRDIVGLTQLPLGSQTVTLAQSTVLAPADTTDERSGCSYSCSGNLRLDNSMSDCPHKESIGFICLSPESVWFKCCP